MRSVRVLVVEDEPKMANLIRRGLTADGIAADIARRGDEGLSMAGAGGYDAIVLDVMLPVMSGLAVCSKLRAEGNWTPILMLTARDAIDDRVAGLDRGADDYLVKPFERAELLARLRAVLRRSPPHAQDRLRVGNLTVDLQRHTATRAERLIELTPREFDLLVYLGRRAGTPVSRDELLREVWSVDPSEPTNTLDVFISNLRRKLEAGGEPRMVQTVRGAGYELRA